VLSGKRYSVLAAVLAALLTCAPAQLRALDVVAMEAATSTVDVTVTTTTETVAIVAPVFNSPRSFVRVVVVAWAQLTTGAATTTVTPRIRRGSTTSGTLISEANAVTIASPAGSTEQLHMIAVELIDGASALEYSLTVEQAGATGDGTVRAAGITVTVAAF
jgi:hypothetical protein